MNIEARFDAREVINNMKGLQLDVPKAVNSALNKTAAKAKTFASKEIRERYNIKAGDLNKNFKLNKSSFSNLQAKIVAIGKGIGLIKFGAKMRNKLLYAKIKRGTGKYILSDPGYFIGRAKNSGSQQVFERIGPKRLPIKKQYGPGPALMFNKKIINSTQKMIAVEFPKQMRIALDYFLQRRSNK